METDPVFGLAVPTACPDVAPDVLWPRNTWADQDAYDATARRIARMFVDNFAQYADRMPAAVCAAGPRIDDQG
jgi:phosphoenolpyruvate carboxykinase (ATP)